MQARSIKMEKQSTSPEHSHSNRQTRVSFIKKNETRNQYCESAARSPLLRVSKFGKRKRKDGRSIPREKNKMAAVLSSSSSGDDGARHWLGFKQI